MHFVRLAPFVVIGGLLTADEHVQRRRDVLRAHAEVRRLLAVDADPELRLADDVVRVDVGHARHFLQRRDQTVGCSGGVRPELGPRVLR